MLDRMPEHGAVTRRRRDFDRLRAEIRHAPEDKEEKLAIKAESAKTETSKTRKSGASRGALAWYNHRGKVCLTGSAELNCKSAILIEFNSALRTLP